MLKSKVLTRFVLFFSVSFILMIILSNFQEVRKLHCTFYAAIATPIFNILNPHVYADFNQGAIENTQNWDIEFLIWDKRDHGREIFSKSYRKKNPPRGKLYQNHHEIILIPFIFLLSLLIASPIHWKQKLVRTAVSIFIFYVLMTLYLSYRFEFTLNREQLPIDSFWHLLITFFGLGGNTDPIYIMVFLLWLFMVIPYIIKHSGLQDKD